MAFCNRRMLLVLAVLVAGILVHQQHQVAAVPSPHLKVAAAVKSGTPAACTLDCGADTANCILYGQCSCGCETSKPVVCQATATLLDCVSQQCVCSCAVTFDESGNQQCSLQCTDPKCEDAAFCNCDAPDACPVQSPGSLTCTQPDSFLACVTKQCVEEKCTCKFTNPTCPTGWSAFDGSCYLAITDSSAQGVYNAFEQECASKAAGAHLASIHSAAENSFIISLIQAADPNKSFFFGLHTLNPPINDGSAFYADGSPVDFGNPVTSPNVAPWNGGEPNNAGNSEACAHFWATNLSVGGLWNDIACTQPNFGAVCKVPKV